LLDINLAQIPESITLDSIQGSLEIAALFTSVFLKHGVFNSIKVLYISIKSTSPLVLSSILLLASISVKVVTLDFKGINLSKIKPLHTYFNPTTRLLGLESLTIRNYDFGERVAHPTRPQLQAVFSRMKIFKLLECSGDVKSFLVSVPLASLKKFRMSGNDAFSRVPIYIAVLCDSPRCDVVSIEELRVGIDGDIDVVPAEDAGGDKEGEDWEWKNVDDLVTPGRYEPMHLSIVAIGTANEDSLGAMYYASLAEFKSFLIRFGDRIKMLKVYAEWDERLSRLVKEQCPNLTDLLMISSLSRGDIDIKRCAEILRDGRPSIGEGKLNIGVLYNEWSSVKGWIVQVLRLFDQGEIERSRGLGQIGIERYESSVEMVMACARVNTNQDALVSHDLLL
jgi:hypothetical protein